MHGLHGKARCSNRTDVEYGKRLQSGQSHSAALFAGEHAAQLFNICERPGVPCAQRGGAATMRSNGASGMHVSSHDKAAFACSRAC